MSAKIDSNRYSICFFDVNSKEYIEIRTNSVDPKEHIIDFILNYNCDVMTKDQLRDLEYMTTHGIVNEPSHREILRDNEMNRKFWYFQQSIAAERDMLKDGII